MDKSKSQIRREEIMGADVNKVAPVVSIGQPNVNKPTHRYFCDACTGTAFTVVYNEMEPVKTVKCKVCGKVQAFKHENLIKM